MRGQEVQAEVAREDRLSRERIAQDQLNLGGRELDVREKLASFDREFKREGLDLEKCVADIWVVGFRF